ncbi:MAG: hypothetical protein HY718_05915 [Planctomycetes bacterium]|nr:hypothetical protein [Planctomycetota bacterium]
MQVGDRLPPLIRTLDLPRLVAYAGATWDWHPVHFDPATAVRFNLPAPVVDGQMLGALLAEQSLDWAGSQAFVRKMAFRIRSMAFAGECVRCDSEVVSVTRVGAVRVVTLRQRVTVAERVIIDDASLDLHVGGIVSGPPAREGAILRD